LLVGVITFYYHNAYCKEVAIDGIEALLVECFRKEKSLEVEKFQKGVSRDEEITFSE